MSAPRSIFSQLLRLALALSLPLLGCIAWGIYQQFRDDRDDAVANLVRLRQFAEKQIRAQLDSARERMQLLAQRIADEEVRGGHQPAEILREFGQMNLEYTNVVLIDRNNQGVAASTRAVGPVDPAVWQSEPVREALAATSFHVGRPLKGPLSGRWIVFLAQPIFADGVRQRTIVLSLDLVELSLALAYDRTERNTVMGVIDDRGTAVVRSAEPEKYLGQTIPGFDRLIAAAEDPASGYGELIGLDGRPRTFTAARLTGTPWYIAASMLTAEVEHDALRNLRRALAAVAAVIAVVGVLLVRRASILAQPLTALAAAARAQAAGQTEATAPEAGSAEIAETARAFNEMVESSRRAAESLRESESRYRTVIDQTGQMVYDFSIASGQLTWFGSTAIPQITGCAAEELNAEGLHGWKDRLHPDERATVIARLENCLATGAPCQAEYRFRHRDGSYRLIEERGVVLRDERGACVRMLGCMSDITRRKKIEADLDRERALLRQIIDLVPHFIFAKDSDGHFILANEQVARVYGTTPEKLLGKSDADFSSRTAEVEHFLAADRAVINEGRPRTIPEETITDAAGQTRYLSTVKIPFRFGAGEIPAVLGVSVDITELKQADQARQQIERKLLETQKLESLGVLAGGIAHDFNNLLTGILGNASLARMDLPQGSPLLPVIEQIELATHRAADLCKQMLAYSGKGRFVVQQLNLNQLVEDTTHLLNISISKNCVLRFNLASALPAVAVDATQVRQIIMNLVINASEAIGSRSGVIAVSTGVARVDRDYIATLLHPGAMSEGDYVFLEVSDNGVGMNAATLGKIFDPFFTTKFTGRGLGLAAVLGIIRGHKGGLKVYSELGRGTTFKILLPCSESPADRLVSAPPMADSRWRGQGTVLVVDDEETVRTVSARILETLGFHVVLAADGQEALAAYRQEPSRFTLVLLDLTMPHLDGEETFRQLRHLNPGVKVVLMSGFNEQEAISRFTGKGLAGFVQKPFEVGSIMAAVREAFFRG